MRKLILLVLIMHFAYSIEFTVDIQYKSIYCISEIIAESTPFHFTSSSDTAKNYTLSFMLLNGTILNKKEGLESIKKLNSYTAFETQYKFCIENNDQDSLFHIRFYQGLELADLKQLPKMEDTKIIQRLVVMITEIHAKIREMDQFSMTVNEYSMQLQKLVSFKSIGFGFLSIVVILAVSFLHYTQIKRVLRNRKII